MTRKKAQTPEFPELCCAACRFCLGERDEWECWGNLPRHLADEELGQSRGEPVKPNWPAGYFFIQRVNG